MRLEKATEEMLKKIPMIANLQLDVPDIQAGVLQDFDSGQCADVAALVQKHAETAIRKKQLAQKNEVSAGAGATTQTGGPSETTGAGLATAQNGGLPPVPPGSTGGTAIENADHTLPRHLPPVDNPPSQHTEIKLYNSGDKLYSTGEKYAYENPFFSARKSDYNKSSSRASLYGPTRPSSIRYTTTKYDYGGGGCPTPSSKYYNDYGGTINGAGGTRRSSRQSALWSDASSDRKMWSML